MPKINALYGRLAKRACMRLALSSLVTPASASRLDCDHNRARSALPGSTAPEVAGRLNPARRVARRPDQKPRHDPDRVAAGTPGHDSNDVAKPGVQNRTVVTTPKRRVSPGTTRFCGAKSGSKPLPGKASVA